MKCIIFIFVAFCVLLCVQSAVREPTSYPIHQSFANFSCKPKQKFKPGPWCHECVCDEGGKSAKCSSTCFSGLIDVLREKLRKLTLPAEMALNSAIYGPRPGDDNFSCKPREWLQPRPWCHSCFCDEEGKMATCPRIICPASPPEWYVLQEALKNTTLEAEITRIFQIITMLKEETQH